MWLRWSSRVATSSRFVYAERVVNKLQRDRIGTHETYMTNLETCRSGSVSQFVGEHASKDNGGLYHYSPFEQVEPGRNQGIGRFVPALGVAASSSPGPLRAGRPDRLAARFGASRFSTESNTLRYMRADPAASATCVECHNRLEQRPEP